MNPLEFADVLFNLPTKPDFLEVEPLCPMRDFTLMFAATITVLNEGHCQRAKDCKWRAKGPNGWSPVGKKEMAALEQIPFATGY